jgi:hypothetical protein
VNVTETIAITIILVLLFIMTFSVFKILCAKPKIDGQIMITMDDAGKKMFSLELDKTPDEIENMKFITFEVIGISPIEAE